MRYGITIAGAQPFVVLSDRVVCTAPLNALQEQA